MLSTRRNRSLVGLLAVLLGCAGAFAGFQTAAARSMVPGAPGPILADASPIASVEALHKSAVAHNAQSEPADTVQLSPENAAHLATRYTGGSVASIEAGVQNGGKVYVASIEAGVQNGGKVYYVRVETPSGERRLVVDAEKGKIEEDGRARGGNNS